MPEGMTTILPISTKLEEGDVVEVRLPAKVMYVNNDNNAAVIEVANLGEAEVYCEGVKIEED